MIIYILIHFIDAFSHDTAHLVTLDLCTHFGIQSPKLYY